MTVVYTCTADSVVPVCEDAMVEMLGLLAGVLAWVGLTIAMRLADIAQMVKEVRDRLPEP